MGNGTEKQFTATDIEEYLKLTQGDVLTIIEAAHPEGSQRESLKSLIKQSINRRLNQVRYEADAGPSLGQTRN